MSQRQRVAVARGDGLGPEIMDAVLRILQAAEAPLDYDTIEIGQAGLEVIKTENLYTYDGRPGFSMGQGE